MSVANDRARRWRRHDLAVAAYITQCDDALEDELERGNGQWPDYLILPFWAGPIERAALLHWLDELQQKSGKAIRIDFDPPLQTQKQRMDA